MRADLAHMRYRGEEKQHFRLEARDYGETNGQYRVHLLRIPCFESRYGFILRGYGNFLSVDAFLCRERLLLLPYNRCSPDCAGDYRIDSVCPIDSLHRLCPAGSHDSAPFWNACWDCAVVAWYDRSSCFSLLHIYALSALFIFRYLFLFMDIPGMWGLRAGTEMDALLYFLLTLWVSSVCIPPAFTGRGDLIGYPYM